MKWTYQKKLIAFMKAKNDLIQDFIRDERNKKGIKTPLKLTYLVMQDLQNITKWPDNEAERVWNDLLFNINNNNLQIQASCPFCMKNDNDCNICEYAKIHGICVEDKNSFDDYSFIYSCIKNLINKSYLEILKNKVNDIQKF